MRCLKSAPQKYPFLTVFSVLLVKSISPISRKYKIWTLRFKVLIGIGSKIWKIFENSPPRNLYFDSHFNSQSYEVSRFRSKFWSPDRDWIKISKIFKISDSKKKPISVIRPLVILLEANPHTLEQSDCSSSFFNQFLWMLKYCVYKCKKIENSFLTELPTV